MTRTQKIRKGRERAQRIRETGDQFAARVLGTDEETRTRERAGRESSETMAQFTPGPWQAAYGSVFTIDAAQEDKCGTRIAMMASGADEPTSPVERDANARLIAAAPELLAAAKGALAAANELMTEFVSKQRAANWGVINDGLYKCEQAIRKAEGRRVRP